MSNISEPFDIRKMANEILGTALPPRPASSIERACRRLAEDVIDSDCSLCSDSVSALAADLKSFAADWVRTEKLRLLRDSVRRSVGLMPPAPALAAEAEEGVRA